MAIKLIIESTEHDLERDDLIFEHSLITFGQSKSCTVELNNPQVNERHFIIRFVEGRYIIMDEGSNLGTALDGEMLEPNKIYELQEQHYIIVPGFNISVFNDGHAPRLERTTVVARKLIGEILMNEKIREQCPRLEQLDGDHIFFFNNEKTSFVLGSSSHLDFVIADDLLVAKEHVSFIRDIFGVKLIPVMDAPTKVGQEEMSEPRIMKHGDLVEIGKATFIFKEHADDTLKELPKANEEAIPETLAEKNPELEKPQDFFLPKKNVPSTKMFDGIFLALFFVVTAGASLVLARLLLSF